MATRDYDEIIEGMDAGLERATLRVLSMRIGAEQTISKDELMFDLNRMGFGTRVKASTFERQVRMCIVSLRKAGHLICASSGDGGYYMARTRAEYESFAEQEYRSKVIDMSETLHAMDAAARTQFGEGVQLGLL